MPATAYSIQLGVQYCTAHSNVVPKTNSPLTCICSSPPLYLWW